MDVHIRKNGFTDHQHEAIVDIVSHIETKIELSVNKAKVVILMSVIPLLAGNTIAVIGMMVKAFH